MTAQEAIQEMQGSILSHPYFNSRSNEALVLEQHINECADNVLAQFPDPEFTAATKAKTPKKRR
ncbi:MAG: hypothetical protein U0264_15745 [Candidatus Kapaibacterium sp.]